jgi:hypothetical protein
MTYDLTTCVRVIMVTRKCRGLRWSSLLCRSPAHATLERAGEMRFSDGYGAGC